MLLSLFEVADYASEQNRRRAGGRRPNRVKAIEGDATAFVDDTIPHGTLLKARREVREDLAHPELRHCSVARPAARTSRPAHRARLDHFREVRRHPRRRARRDRGNKRASQGSRLRLLKHCLLQDGRRRRLSLLPRCASTWARCARASRAEYVRRPVIAIRSLFRQHSVTMVTR